MSWRCCLLFHCDHQSKCWRWLCVTLFLCARLKLWLFIKGIFLFTTFYMPVVYTRFDLIRNTCMYPSIMDMHGWMCTVGVLCGSYVFSSSALVVFFFFFNGWLFCVQGPSDAFAHWKQLQQCKVSSQTKEIIHLLNMEQTVANMLVASVVVRKHALEQKI